MQDAAFMNSEGNNWFSRNRDALGTSEAVRDDPVLRLLHRNKVKPRSALEIGCANGWRLEALRLETGAVCVGVDASADAVADGKARYPNIELRHGSASLLPFSGMRFDVVALYFVLHWLDRRTLLRALADADECVADGGWLVVGDFMPPAPVAVPYHHREGLFTYHANYAQALCGLGLYDVADAIVFEHGGDRWPASAGCFLLRRRMQ